MNLPSRSPPAFPSLNYKKLYEKNGGLTMKFGKLLRTSLLSLALLASALPLPAAAAGNSTFASDLASLVAATDEDYYFGQMTLTLGSQELELDGQTIQMDVAPMVDTASSRTLLPIRYVAEATGATVDWDADSNCVVITTAQGDEIRCPVGASYIESNGVSIASDTPTTAADDRVFVPLRIVSETLGLDVQWVQETSSVVISAPWQTSRVLVWSDTRPDTSGAEEVLYNGSFLFVLQYGSPTEAKAACESLQDQGYTAAPDAYLPPVESPSGASASASSHNSWGVASSGFDAFIDQYAAALTGHALVAVVDTGVDDSVPALSGRVINGQDFVDGDSDPDDEHYHGTHVASTILDCVGDLDVDILAERVLDENGEGATSQVVSGIVDATARGADIINLSLGGPKSSSDLIDAAIAEAVEKGTTVCVSAGNESSDAKYYCPAHLGAEYDGVIAVGAVDSSGKTAYFSNDGEDILAPGVDIKAYVPGGSLRSLDGTSMAAPHVSAAASLFYLADSSAAPAQIESALKSAARNGILDLSGVALPGGSTPQPEKEVTSYTYSVSSLELNVGDSASVTVTAHYSDGTTADVTSQAGLYSTDESIVTVSSSGAVSAKGPGSAYISMASAAGVSIPAPIQATVTQPQEEQPQPAKEIVSYRWSEDSLELQVDEIHLGLRLYAVYSDGSEADVTEQSNLYTLDPSIATVTPSGSVTGHAPGTTLLTFSFAGVSDETVKIPAPVTITVHAAQPEPQPEDGYVRLFWAIKNDNTSLNSEIDSLSLSVGRTLQVGIYGEKADGSIQDLTSLCQPYSSDESVAKLSGGKLTAVGTGTCYLWLAEIPNTELELPPLLLVNVQ